jgi:hypothetical protein
MSKRKKTIKDNETAKTFNVTDWAEKNQYWLTASVLILFTVLSLLMFDPKPFVGGDNAAYVALSKSLVQGKGLTEIWTPENKPHTQYPFGFPILLAPVSLLRLPYAWYKLVPWLSGLLSLLALTILIKNGTKIFYIIPAFLLAINPHFLEYAHWVLSELPFMFFVLLTFLAMKRWEGKGGYLWLGISILSAVFANYIRSAGIALYLGIFLYLLFKRKFKEASIFIAGCIIFTMPWSLRNSHYGTSGGYLDQFLMKDPYQPELGFLGTAGLFKRFFANSGIYFLNVMPRMLVPSVDAWGLSGAAPLVMFLAVIPAVIILLFRLIKMPKAYDWFVLIYLGMSMLWPETWSDIRFLLPILPFFILYLVQAYGYMLGWIFKKRILWPASTVLVLIIVSNIWAGWSPIKNNLEANKYRSHDKYSGYAPAWHSFFTAVEWIKNNTPQNSIVVSRKPTLFFMGSERRSFCYPFTTNQDSLLKSIDRADYVMIEPVSGTGQRFLIPAVQPLLDKKFKIIYANGNPPAYVLQVVKERENVK